MKIWIFNVLVAGALAYLFLGESEQTRVKGDLEWAKDKVETTIENNRLGDGGAQAGSETHLRLSRPQSVREKVTLRETADHQDALDKLPRVVKPLPENKIKAAEPTPPPAEPKSEIVIEQQIETADAAPTVNVKTGPLRREQASRPVVTSEPLEAPKPTRAEMLGDKDTVKRVALRDAAASTAGAQPLVKIEEDLPPLDDPEVARRRAVVLDTERTDERIASAGETPAAAEQVTAMAARERRDALNALAVDMELLFVDKTSR